MPPKQRKPGRPNVTERDIPTRDHILDVAAKQFLEYGYESVSTQQIAEACGVTKAMVYYYFSSKPNLLSMAIVKLMRQVCDRTEEILNTSLPLYERLYQIALRRLQVNTKLDMDILLKTEKSPLTDEQRLAIQDAEDKLMTILSTAFDQAIGDREIRFFDSRFTARMYVTMLSVGMHSEFNHWDPEKRVEEMMQMFWHGITQNESIERE